MILKLFLWNFSREAICVLLSGKISRPYRNRGRTSIYLQLLSRSITDHHLRCGGWLNFEFSKRGKTFGMGH